MKLLKIIVLVALVAVPALAQRGADQLTGLSWHIGIPAGQMSNFMDKTSYGGFGVEFRRFLDENTSLGGSFSWNMWSQQTNEVIPIENGAVGGTQIRYYNVLPLLLNGHYYFGEVGQDIRPYVGLNIGAYIVYQRLDIGIYTMDNDQWHFGLAPEAGFLWQMDARTHIMIAARYNYAFDAGETLGGKDDNSIAYLGINLGIAWTTGWF